MEQTAKKECCCEQKCKEKCDLDVCLHENLKVNWGDLDLPPINLLNVPNK